MHPVRRENGYRDYSQQDLQALGKIKLLRHLGLSIETIRTVQAGELTLSAALAVALAVSAALAWRRSRRRGRAGLGCDAGCAGCAARAEVAAEDEPRAEAR